MAHYHNLEIIKYVYHLETGGSCDLVCQIISCSCPSKWGLSTMLQLIDYLHCTVDEDVLIDMHSLSVSCKHNYVSNYKEASSQNT